MTPQSYIISKYCSFKVIEDNVIGASYVNKVLFALDVEKYALLQKYADHLEQLKFTYPVLFSTLSKLGIIRTIEDETNIKNQFLLNNRVIVFNDCDYRLTINPTLNCNFSCWYCYETHNKKFMQSVVKESVIKYIDKIVSQGTINKLYLDWFGGEPLLCYRNVIIPLITETQKICKRHNTVLEGGITTNGYLINDEMINFFKDTNMQSFQITLDGQKTDHNKIRYTYNDSNTYDKIIANIIKIAEIIEPENLAVRINYTKESVKNILDIANYIPQQLRPKITILLQQVWQDKDMSGSITLQEQEEIKYKFQKVGFKTDTQILNCRGYTCYADLYHQAVINYDGRVFKCTARDFAKEKADGILTQNGSIEWHLLSKRLSKSTFENNYCFNCEYLPICAGPCSQKTCMINYENFESYCFKQGIEETLTYIMSEFAKSGIGLTPILEYH